MLKAKLSGKSAICDYKSGSCCCNDTNYNNLSAFFVLNRHAYQNHIALVKNGSKRTEGSSQDNNTKIIKILKISISDKVLLIT